MVHLTIGPLIFGALILIVGIVLAVSTFLENRRAESEPFRDYLGPAYERDLGQYSTFSETEDWLADDHSDFVPFLLHDPEVDQPRTKVNGVAQPDRESN